jgi:hypothetical protein
VHKYANCTRISGNVEINGLSLADLKREGGIGGEESEKILNAIFHDIEQIDGYLLVYNVTATLGIELPRLQYIWGNTLHPAQLDTDLFVPASVAFLHSTLVSISMPSLICMFTQTIIPQIFPYDLYSN